MMGRVGVRRRVLVGRIVAAQRLAALLTRPKMHPLAADLDALFANVSFSWGDRRDRAQMRTNAA